MVGLNNSMESLSKNALKSLKNYTPIYDEQWKYTKINLFDKYNFDSSFLPHNLKISNNSIDYLSLKDATLLLFVLWCTVSAVFTLNTVTHQHMWRY